MLDITRESKPRDVYRVSDAAVLDRFEYLINVPLNQLYKISLKDIFIINPLYSTAAVNKIRSMCRPPTLASILEHMLSDKTIIEEFSGLSYTTDDVRIIKYNDTSISVHLYVDRDPSLPRWIRRHIPEVSVEDLDTSMKLSYTLQVPNSIADFVEIVSTAVPELIQGYSILNKRVQKCHQLNHLIP